MSFLVTTIPIDAKTNTSPEHGCQLSRVCVVNFAVVWRGVWEEFANRRYKQTFKYSIRYRIIWFHFHS